VNREPEAHPPFLILEQYLARSGLAGLLSNIEILEDKPGVWIDRGPARCVEQRRKMGARERAHAWQR
jgi:hypothetical protein